MPSELPAGQKLREPEQLFRKLDPGIVEEELRRLDASVIDTHAHLDALDDPAADGPRPGSGVDAHITVGTDPASWARALGLAEEHEGVYAVARAPSPRGGSERGPGSTPSLLGHPKAVALGEIGLDYYRDYAPREVQRRRSCTS